MSDERLLNLFKVLKLHGILSHFAEVLETADLKSTDLVLLKRLLEIELAYREGRSFKYRLKIAKLPQIKSLEHFDFSNVPIKSEQLQKLSECDFIKEKLNLLFIGGSGTGKTHLALSLAYTALVKNYRIRFYSFNDLARNLLKAKTHHYEANLMQHLERYQLLIIDEMGYLPIETQAGSLLFQLFSRLYERTPIILTTHLTFDEWGSLFGNPKASKAMIDRLTHHCLVLETGDTSWRLKEGKQHKKKSQDL
jgi:DNA replication protein DnaC